MAHTAARVTKRLWEMADVVDMLEAWENSRALNRVPMPRTFRPIAVLILVLAIIYLEARALGRIPAYVQYCENSQHTGHEECATYHVALFAFGQIRKFFDAISPAITAFATGFIALFTATIWAINRSQLKHGRQVERGYVSGGFGQRDDTNRYFASIHNNGKTPVVIDYMLIGICPLNQLPLIPEISKRQYVNYSLPPLTRTVALNCWADWNGKPDHVFFGRFWYTDIFEQTHESGFALHLKEAMPAADAPEYWRWTYTESLKL
jgi:hypothetical protein